MCWQTVEKQFIPALAIASAVGSNFMNDDQKQYRRIILATIVCLSFLVLTFFYHHIDKWLTGAIFVFLTLMIPITFVLIFILWVKGIIQIKRNWKQLSFTLCLPTIICTVTILFIFFNRFGTSEQFESEVEFRACYEGTQNQAYILFRKDKTFEVNSTGVFFADKWWTGHWNKKDNILTLKYDKKKFDVLGDSLLIKDGHLIPLKPMEDTTRTNRPIFYLGFCKGEN